MREHGLRTAAVLTAPLLAIVSAGAERRDLPPRGSFVQVEPPEVEIVALAPSRRGHDLVAFLHSHAPEPVEAQVAFGLLPVVRAWAGSFLERGLEELLVQGETTRVRLYPGEYATLALDLNRAH